jgi:3-oxoadipate enol-lactonase
MSTSAEMRLWQLNSVRSGPRGQTPVVLVHPVGLDLTYWGPQMDALCDLYDVVAFDLPGQGRSPGTPQDWSIPQAVSFLQQIVKSTGAPAAHLVGLSVGGIISQAFSVAHPERVRSLTLISTAPTFSEQSREAMRRRAVNVRQGGMHAVLQECLERWFTEATVSRRPDLIDRVTKTLLAVDPKVHGAMWDMISAVDIVSDLHRITAPTLIMTGELDPSSPPSSAKLLHEEIAASELHIFPGFSHMLPLEAPSVVNNHLLRFLANGSTANTKAY